MLSFRERDSESHAESIAALHGKWVERLRLDLQSDKAEGDWWISDVLADEKINATTSSHVPSGPGYWCYLQ